MKINIERSCKDRALDPELEIDNKLKRRDFGALISI